MPPWSTIPIASVIANQYVEASNELWKSVLVELGLLLLVVTVVINTLARVLIVGVLTAVVGATVATDLLTGSSAWALAVLAGGFVGALTTLLAVGAFVGAARYALGTPAYGWWLGAGAQWRNVLPGWDLNLDYRYGVELARERSLPSDIQGGYRSEAFYNITGFALYMSRKF